MIGDAANLFIRSNIELYIVYYAQAHNSHTLSLGLNILPMDSSTCRLEEPGIELLTLIRR